MTSQSHLSDTQIWRDRRGRITQTVRGSHVDITVRLGQIGQRSWSILVAIAGITTLAVIGKIVEAFLSGRVQQVLSHIKAVQ